MLERQMVQVVDYLHHLVYVLQELRLLLQVIELLCRIERSSQADQRGVDYCRNATNKLNSLSEQNDDG